MTDLTKLTVYATPEAMSALTQSATHTGLTRTDTLNRAVQLYAGVTRSGFWSALRLLLAERATVRRFANSAVGCPDCGDVMLPAEVGQHARARHGDS